MSNHSSFFASFSSPNSSWYREKREEQWSPRSQESDLEPSFDSDEGNQESKAITIYSDSSSGLSSLESSPLVPWLENSSYLRSSSSKSLVLHPRGNSLTQEGTLTPQCEATSLRVSTSLVIGKRPRALGLKDVDLSKNVMARHIREAKEANKSPKKSNFRSPLSRHMSCPIFSCTNDSFMGLSDRHGVPGITGQIGENRDLNFVSTVHRNSPANTFSTPTSAGKVRLFSCPDDQPNFDQLRNTRHQGWHDELAPHKMSSDGTDRNFTPKGIEVIDLTSGEATSTGRITNYSDKATYKDSCQKDESIIALTAASQNHSPFKRRVSNKKSVLTFSDDEDSDSKKQDQVHFSLKKHVSRKRSVLSFSDDEEDSDSAGQKSVEVTAEKSQQVIQAGEEVSLKSNYYKRYMKMGVLFALFVLLLSIYLHKNPHGFCLDSEFSKNISGIGLALKAEVYGQHIAQKVVTSALKNHFAKHNARKPLVLSFHGWTGVGKNFVTSIITEHFFKHKTHSSFVHKFIVPVHFPHDSEIDKYNEQLRSWIQGNISQCSKGGLFIFDEMDKIHLGMMSTIKDIILGFRGKEVAAGYQNMVFIFLSNSGGHAVNQHVLKHALDGKLRQSLMLKEMELIFQGMIKQTPDAWFADLLKSDVIDHLVPFLPLERTHVKQCIRRDLILKGFHVREALVSEIADQMEYFPDGHGFFSVSGCKKVSSRVDVIVG